MLIKCTECGREISDQASTCPNCGYPMQVQTQCRASVYVNDSSWGDVYAAIDRGDLMCATKLIKTITGASIQEARATAVLLNNNRSAHIQATGTKVNIRTNDIGAQHKDAVRCLKCGKLYYKDMAACPGCSSPNNAATTSYYVDPSKVICASCKSHISKQTEVCPHCGHPTGVHVCPKCNSANTKVISDASKATSIFLWGPFAANKVLSRFQCKDCGYKF